MITYPVIEAKAFDPNSDEPLQINAPLVAEWLVQFLRDEVGRRRGFQKVLLGLSGGVDSSLVAYLCARAFGAENVHAFLMPYKISSPESLEHGHLVVQELGIHSRVIEITPMVDAYLSHYEPEATPTRIGNICARTRMIILFDQSAKLNALPIGTGNKSERLFGYFTWHADDAPPVNPIGDLFKTQVWQLARYVGVPDVIVNKPASADLIVGQTDEGDFGISYKKADRILHFLTQGFSPERLVQMGFSAEEVALVKRKVDSTHWKRHLPTTAMLSTTAIGEYYLRPVDF
ncbi:MAG: NAD+ synthase [Fimbriimonadales bacterium]